MVAGASVLNLVIAAPLMIGITLIFGLTDDSAIIEATDLLQKISGEQAPSVDSVHHGVLDP
jgi:hypothetical protein